MTFQRTKKTEPMPQSELPLVSALFITYKRFDLLKKAVEGFRRNTAYPNLELVIADDGSGREIQAQIRTLPADVFALARKNAGLGANNNNGLRHCHGKYILMIQDDWECQGPTDYLLNCVKVMEANPQVGIINFAGAVHPADLKQPLIGSDEPCYVTPTPAKTNKIEYLYADQPHIRSRAALEHVGFYIEHRDQDQCEIDYSIRWQQQTRFLTAAFPHYYHTVFRNSGTAPGRSFRLKLFRYRVHAFLMPAKPFLVKYANPLFRVGKATVNGGVRALEKLRIVK
jgi:glycosyltransferase involved in cell wall biosynthesis